MPLYKKIKINKEEFVLIWHISETKQELLDSLKQDSSFNSKLNSIKSKVKQIEFLSVLNLLEKQNLSFEDIEQAPNTIQIKPKTTNYPKHSKQRQPIKLNNKFH